MTRAVRLTARAEKDLKRLEDFLSDKNPDASLRAANSITEAVLSLAEHAERGFRGPAPSLRQIAVPFGDSGYIIQYRVETHLVVVARIKHARERR
ncbi:type II toxin-antitoxin system RelE/ParE family toxin [Caulobacter sp. ErkDOM-E]|uniref:type II toxin-antitoxin system RelE/ParE family toxin n=1 Tax=Caulobacter sp. ErkDOM-E TaxID=3402778 RepID=UPI002743B184|nr:type II toxin-antitoxin system RelE/ParE family toxin [Hyphomicrobium sp.]